MPKKPNKHQVKIRKRLKVIGHRENLDMFKEVPKQSEINELEEKKFIIKNIIPDGNSFYRTLSYYFRDTEDDHAIFRTLILDYIETNKEEYIPIISDKEIKIKIEENLNENIIKGKRLNI